MRNLYAGPAGTRVMIDQIAAPIRSGTFWIYVLSLSVALGIYAAGCIFWFSDSHSYTNYAYWLAHGEFNPHLYWRTPGYPIALILTGAVAFASLRGIILLQVLSGALIPAAIYWSVRPLSRIAAIGASVVAIISLVPFALVTTIYPDQLYMSALVCFAALLVRYATADTKPAIVYFLTLTLLALFLLRPVGLVLAGLALAVIVFRRKHLRHVFFGGFAFLVAIGFLVAYERHETGGATPPSMFGRQLFLNVYLSGDGPIKSSALISRVTADMDRLKSAHVNLLACGPQETAEQAKLLYGRFESNADLAAQFFRQPTIAYFWNLHCLTEMTDPGLDHILGDVALTRILSNPLQWISGILGRYFVLSAGRSTQYALDATPGLDQLSPDPHIFYALTYTSSDPAAAAADSIVKFSGLREVPAWANPLREVVRKAFGDLYSWIVPTSYFLMVFGLVFWLAYGGTLGTASLVVFAIHATNVGATAALVPPEYRYQIHTLPIAIMGAGFGLSAAWCLALKVWHYAMSADPVST